MTILVYLLFFLAITLLVAGGVVMSSAPRGIRLSSSFTLKPDHARLIGAGLLTGGSLALIVSGVSLLQDPNERVVEKTPAERELEEERRELDRSRAGFLTDDGERYLLLGELDEAVKKLDEALKLDPENTDALHLRGLARNRLGLYDDAVADYSDAIDLNPDWDEAHVNRAHVYIKQGNNDGAMADCNAAIELNSDSADAYEKRALVHYRNRDYRAALDDYTKTTRLRPNDGRSLRQIAWIHATCPVEELRDGKEAIRQAERACELNGESDWRSFDTLAAAHAEAGDFEAALYWQDRALAISPVGLEPRVRARRELYEQEVPFRDHGE
jgi:tetratricopeptide (TPR) repeat protein